MYRPHGPITEDDNETATNLWFRYPFCIAIAILFALAPLVWQRVLTAIAFLIIAGMPRKYLDNIGYVVYATILLGLVLLAIFRPGPF